MLPTLARRATQGERGGPRPRSPRLLRSKVSLFGQRLCCTCGLTVTLDGGAAVPSRSNASPSSSSHRTDRCARRSAAAAASAASFGFFGGRSSPAFSVLARRLATAAPSPRKLNLFECGTGTRVPCLSAPSPPVSADHPIADSIRKPAGQLRALRWRVVRHEAPSAAVASSSVRDGPDGLLPPPSDGSAGTTVREEEGPPSAPSGPRRPSSPLSRSTTSVAVEEEGTNRPRYRSDGDALLSPAAAVRDRAASRTRRRRNLRVFLASEADDAVDGEFQAPTRRA
mmetsp:Transcript_7368/g.15956  ORF Transcript_7368/g.15956 Transcript_7368/m.15956 type:complete len:283 (+) Transcript_7368:586-1434(+)